MEPVGHLLWRACGLLRWSDAPDCRVRTNTPTPQESPHPEPGGPPSYARSKCKQRCQRHNTKQKSHPWIPRHTRLSRTKSHYPPGSLGGPRGTRSPCAARGRRWSRRCHGTPPPRPTPPRRWPTCPARTMCSAGGRRPSGPGLRCRPRSWARRARALCRGSGRRPPAGERRRLLPQEKAAMLVVVVAVAVVVGVGVLRLP